MPRTGLDEFREVVTDFRSFLSWTLNVAIVAPIADFVIKLGPTWPSGLPIITTLVEVIVLMLLFHFFARKAQRRISRVMYGVLCALVFAFPAYLVIRETYTFESAVTKNRDAKGFVLRPEVATLIPASVTDADDALVKAEYEPKSVWTPGSITAVKMTLLGLWLVTFASLVASLASFVLLQRKRHVAPLPRPVQRGVPHV